MVTVEWTSHSDTNSNPSLPLTAYEIDSCCDEDLSVEDQSSIDSYLVPDPYRCTLQIEAKDTEIDYLKKLYGPLLEGLDPTFQFITLSEGAVNSSPVSISERDAFTIQGEEHEIECPSLGVILFLYEKFGRLSALTVQNSLKSPPWKFHHRIELPQNKRPRVIARQDFYFLTPDLPLWAISPVHYGNEHLRFHIFVRNLSQMKQFYEAVTGIKSHWNSPTFCCITVYSQRGLDIQLSLKHLPQVFPKPTNAVRLRFKIRSISLLTSYLISSPIPLEDGAWFTADPEGNPLILVETIPNQCKSHQRLHISRSLDTSDYDTASAISANTESNESFEQCPRNCLFITSLEETLI